jgi:hypothetical protein
MVCTGHILISINNLYQYNKLDNVVSGRLAKNEFVILPKRFIWYQQDMEFLGYIITSGIMRMAKNGIEAIEYGQT